MNAEAYCPKKHANSKNRLGVNSIESRGSGILFRIARLEAGLTEDDMAEQLGMSRQNYSYIEQGTPAINLTVLRRITAILGHTKTGKVLKKFEPYFERTDALDKAGIELPVASVRKPLRVFDQVQGLYYKGAKRCSLVDIFDEQYWKARAGMYAARASSLKHTPHQMLHAAIVLDYGDPYLISRIKTGSLSLHQAAVAIARYHYVGISWRTGVYCAFNDQTKTVKIGQTATLHRRAGTVSVQWIPTRADAVAYIECSNPKAVERELQELEEKYRMSGEWFRYKGPIAKHPLLRKHKGWRLLDKAQVAMFGRFDFCDLWRRMLTR